MSELYFELPVEEGSHESAVLEQMSLPDDVTLPEEDVLDYQSYRDWRYSLPKETKGKLEPPTRFDLAKSLLEYEPGIAVGRDLVETSEQLEGDVRRKAAGEEDLDRYDAQRYLSEALNEHGGTELVDMDEFTDELIVRTANDRNRITVE